MATSIKLDDQLKNRVQQLATVRRHSAHWIMREAIRTYVEREEAKESFKQEALDSWTTYKETGRHITGEELQQWLSTWGTNDDQEMPACHE